MYREDAVCMYNGLLLSHKKNEILSVSTTWTDLEGATLSEISPTETDKYYMISLNVDSKKQKQKNKKHNQTESELYIYTKTNRWLPKRDKRNRWGRLLGTKSMNREFGMYSIRSWVHSPGPKGGSSSETTNPRPFSVSCHPVHVILTSKVKHTPNWDSHPVSVYEERVHFST